jgi:hypothetical protein
MQRVDNEPQTTTGNVVRCRPCMIRIASGGFRLFVFRFIVSAVKDVARQEGIEDGSEMRLIFHVFKTTGKREKGRDTKSGV